KGGGPPAGDEGLVPHGREPSSEVLDQRPIAHRQGRLVVAHAAAAPARQNHEAAAASHGKSLPALGYCPIAPLMLQKTFATWLPRMISSTITTTAIKTRISAYSTIPWPCSLRTR